MIRSESMRRSQKLPGNIVLALRNADPQAYARNPYVTLEGLGALLSASGEQRRASGTGTGEFELTSPFSSVPKYVWVMGTIGYGTPTVTYTSCGQGILQPGDIVDQRCLGLYYFAGLDNKILCVKTTWSLLSPVTITVAISGWAASMAFTGDNAGGSYDLLVHGWM